jgi:predicted dehydrogenase
MHGIGAAVVGTGFMGDAHVEALRRAGVTVVGVLGSDEAKTRATAERLGILRAYPSYEKLLSDPDVQSVHVATPNRLHFAMSRDALRAGRHVLCEKPLAMTSAESAELADLARRHPRQAAGVNYNVRFYPLCIEARERVRRGDLGPVFHIGGSYAQDWLLLDTDYNWRVLPEHGGELRAVSDIGTTITGLEVEAVCADLRTVHPVRKRPRGEVETYKGKESDLAGGDPVAISTEDYGGLMLRFRGRARGMVWVSQVTAGRKNCIRFEIAGAKAALAWESEQPDELWIGRRDKANEVLAKDPSLLSPAARKATGYPGGHAEGYPDTFKQCFRAFYGWIAAGDPSAPPPFPTFADGHREIVLCEAVLESHRRGGWVTVPGSH